jgi:hypothetical protein
MERNVFRPQIFSVEKNNLDVIQALKKENANLKIVDSMESQLLELVKILNPSALLSRESEINGINKIENLDSGGNWVYCSSNQIVLLLLNFGLFIKVIW